VLVNSCYFFFFCGGDGEETSELITCWASIRRSVKEKPRSFEPTVLERFISYTHVRNNCTTSVTVIVTLRISFKKTTMNDFNICKDLSQWGPHVSPNQSCGPNAVLTESCPAAVQALCLLSLKLTSSVYQTRWRVRRLDIFHFRFSFHTGSHEQSFWQTNANNKGKERFASELFKRILLSLLF
jgi:hypothetical protein